MKRGRILKNYKEMPIKNIIAYLFAFISVVTVIYYMFGPSEGYLHSDCVDTLSWAYASVESGQMFSESYYYPYLLPFCGTFLFYPFVKVFGFSMLAYRLSMLTFMVLFGLSIYFVTRKMKFSRNFSLITLGVCLLTLSSSNKLRELFWEHIIHYSVGNLLGMVLIVLSFIFWDRYKKTESIKERKTAIFLVLIGLWAFFSAFNGLTTLTLCSLPFVGALIFVILFNKEREIFSKENKGYYFVIGVIILMSILGLVVFNLMAGDIATNYGDSNSNIVGKEEWMNNALKFLGQWVVLLGADFKLGQAITHFPNVLAAVKTFASLVIVIIPFCMIKMYKKLNEYEKIFLIYHYILCAFIFYGYVFGMLSSVNWRLSPIILSSLILNVCFWKILWQEADNKRIAGIFSSIIVLGCGITVFNIFSMPPDYGRDNDHHKAIEFIKEVGLDYGYATYWNANILTLLSSNEVKVRDVNFDNGTYKNGWLNTDRIWYEDREEQDKYFILFTRDEYENRIAENHPILENCERVLNSGNWYILIKDENIF